MRRVLGSAMSLAVAARAGPRAREPGGGRGGGRRGTGGGRRAADLPDRAAQRPRVRRRGGARRRDRGRVRRPGAGREDASLVDRLNQVFGEELAIRFVLAPGSAQPQPAQRRRGDRRQRSVRRPGLLHRRAAHGVHRRRDAADPQRGGPAARAPATTRSGTWSWGPRPAARRTRRPPARSTAPSGARAAPPRPATVSCWTGWRTSSATSSARAPLRRDVVRGGAQRRHGGRARLRVVSHGRRGDLRGRRPAGATPTRGSRR